MKKVKLLAIAFFVMGFVCLIWYMFSDGPEEIIRKQVVKMDGLKENKMDQLTGDISNKLQLIILKENELKSLKKDISELQRCYSSIKNSLGTIYPLQDCSSYITGIKLGINFNPVYAIEEDTGDNYKKRDVRLIVIHHAGNDQFDLAKEIKSSDARHKKTGSPKSKLGYYIRYHYVIGRDGQIVQTRKLDEVGYSTQNNNYQSVGVELLGNFKNYTPTSQQYASLNKVVKEVEDYFGRKMTVKGHGQLETESTSCPGKMFDYAQVIYGDNGINDQDMVYSEALDPELDMDYLGDFNLSRYYSPMPGQNKYYMGKSYEEDKKMNAGEGDATVTADGHKLSDSERGKSVACPSSIPLGSKLYIKGYGTVTCHDRGSAIVENRIDMRCGIGEVGLKRLTSGGECITGKKKVYMIKDTKLDD